MPIPGVSGPAAEPHGAAYARAIVANARAEGRAALFEHEGYAVLEAFGLSCPAHVFVPDPALLTDVALDGLQGPRVVLKIVSPTLLHKSAAGGVAVVTRHDVRAEAVAMKERLRSFDVAGVLMAELVPHERALGHEVLVTAQHAREFGPLVTMTPGGAGAEFLASRLDPAHRLAVVAGGRLPGVIDRAVGDATVVRLATTELRAGGAGLPWPALAAVLERMQLLAGALAEMGLLELEVNPFVVSGDRLVAVDALATLRQPDRPALPRPLGKMRCLLQPRRVAIAGVSGHMNPGRVIVRNLLRDGFPREAIRIVKPGVDQIDGCAAVPSVASLEEPVDLLVLAVAASEAAAMALEAITGARAESIVLVPGGFEEKGGSESLAAGIRAALDEARATPSLGPLVLGGNCLGFRSRPGRCDTLFIPDYKLPVPAGPAHPLAVISQSGAFAIARADRWGSVSPAYIISAGNQVDLTIGDCLAWLQDDQALRVFAVYVEGFKPLDGLRTLEAAGEIARSGRTVVLYRAGRTPDGAQATASHTASIAGDYLVTRALFEQAGAIVADDVGGFDDAVRLALALDGKRPRGRRVAAVSNAGFECVVMADRLGALELSVFSAATRSTIAHMLRGLRIDTVVDVHNPLDLTPMADAAAYEAAVRAVLADDGVDLAVVACVPLTPALHTLPAGDRHTEDLSRDDALPARLGRLARESAKPFALVVDAGRRYDAFSTALEDQGLVVFRSADRALRALDAYVVRQGGSPAVHHRPHP